MWGDDPEDFKEKELDHNGRWVTKLPIDETLPCGCVVELEWVVTAGSGKLAHACVATGVRLGGNCHPHDVEDRVKALTRELFRRYQKYITESSKRKHKDE